MLSSTMSNEAVFSSLSVCTSIPANLNNFIGIMVERTQLLSFVSHNLLKKEYISSRDEIVNKKIRVYYHIEPIGKEYLEQTIIEFRKNMQGVFEIIAYGEGKKDE